MENPFFSIIIPTLNEENFLPRLLKDLTKQKVKDFEVIVVDGHSNDNTQKIALSFKDYFSDFSLIDSLKRNVSFQRNLGAKRAKGKFLVFIDADERINSSFLENLKKEISKTPALVFIPALAPQSQAYQEKLIFKVVNLLIELSQLTAKPFSSGGTMIVERNFFYFSGGFDEKLFLAEDHEFIQRAKKMGVSCRFLRQVKVKFSLRRLKKEGRLELWLKYIIASLHYLARGRIDRKIFDYQMGGDYYKFSKEKEFFLEKMIKNYFQQLKKQLTFKK